MPSYYDRGPMPSYYDRAGNPITLEQWMSTWTETLKRVALYEDKDVVVSTVWLGLDHNWDDKGPPLIFETMVFEGTWKEVSCKRYSTEAQALVGHDQVVAQVLEDFEGIKEMDD